MAKLGHGKSVKTAAALAAALALAGCGTTGGGTDERTEADIVYTRKPILAAVLSGGEYGGDGLLPALAAEAARLSAEKETRIDLASASVERMDGAAQLAALDAWIAEGRDRLLALDWSMAETLDTVAAANPAAHLAILEGVSTAPNLVALGFRRDEIGFLSGWAAALAARETGFQAVGFMGAFENELEVTLEAAFVAGARAAWPEVLPLVLYVPLSSGAEEPARKIAEALYARGAAAIALSPWVNPAEVLAAARDAAGSPRWAIGLLADLKEQGWRDELAERVLLSVTGKGEALALEALRLLAAEDFEGGRELELGAAAGALAVSGVAPGTGESLVPELEAVLQRLAAGEFEIPDFPEERYLR